MSIFRKNKYFKNKAMKKVSLFTSTILFSCVAIAAGNFTFYPSKDVALTSSNCSGINYVLVGINKPLGTLELEYNVITNTLPNTSCWTVSMCDNNTCYPYIPTNGVLRPLSASVTAVSNVFTLDVTPNNYIGSAIIQIEVYDSNNPANKDTLTFNITGCTSGTYCPLGIADMTTIENSMNIYPNPVKDQLIIKTNNINFFTEKIIGVYNILGEKVLNFKLNKTDINTIDIASLNSGIYFVKYEAEKGNTVTKKFYKSSE